MRQIKYTFIILFGLGFFNDLFGQQLTIKIHNLTGFDIESLEIREGLLGNVRQNQTVTIKHLKSINIQDGVLYFGAVRGNIKGKEENKKKLGLCSNGVEVINSGQINFDLTVDETVSGYRLHLKKTANASH
jgi:hypothetical protein